MALRRAAAAREALLLRDASGDLLAWVGRSEEAPTEAASVTVEGCIKIRYPWDLLAVNAAAVAEACRAGSATTDLGAGVTVDGAVVVGSGTRFLPGVYIEGNVVVGRDCKIGPNCYIRGATSIGDGCHVGQAVEIKNSILMAGVGIGHLSYCGDSVVGVKANFGAGTITANFRHDGQSHRSKIGAQLVNTGLRKLGATIGDGVHTGIHTSIYPGRKIWPGQSTRPGAVVQSDVVGDSGCR
jgi:bifunctional UDP-N-acetylglucosamine pyrophosphorylase/glucosamine-1-phosphate N-acetyltransferase